MRMSQDRASSKPPATAGPLTIAIVGLRELTRAGREYSSGTFQDFQTWLVVGVLYLIMTLALSKVASLLEARLGRAGS